MPFLTRTRSPLASLRTGRGAGPFPLPAPVYCDVLRRIALDGLTYSARLRTYPVGRAMIGTGLRKVSGRSVPTIGTRAAMLHLISGSPAVRNDPARLQRCRDIISGIPPVR